MVHEIKKTTTFSYEAVASLVIQPFTFIFLSLYVFSFFFFASDLPRLIFCFHGILFSSHPILNETLVFEFYKKLHNLGNMDT